MYETDPMVHIVYMAKKVTPRFRQRARFRPTFIRQWRGFRGLTLEALAGRVGTTHATLSRMERGLTPYSQPLLEAIAEALSTDAASLLMRNPEDPEGIWSVWDQAKPGERRMIVDIARTVLKTGT
jgi:transcriptional regulator with XRE-family HTH domain